MPDARFERRPAPSPSFNYGWRLGVVVGSAMVLMVITGLWLAILGRVLDVVF